MTQFKFKKGDKVRVTVFNDENFNFGEILTVDENDEVPYCINSEGARWAMDEDELDLVESHVSLWTKFKAWFNYCELTPRVENLEEDYAIVDERLDDIEETMEALLAKLGVHTRYVIDEDIFSDKEFKVTIVDNEIVKVKKTKTPKTKKTSTDRSKTGGKK